MLQKQHACIMQLIRIADSQVEEYLVKFINAYVRPDSSNLVAIDRDLLELWHSKKIFYAQLKKMEHLVEESPYKKDQAITLCGTFCMINFCPYHIQHIQALLPIDLQQRITFVHGFFIDDPQFLCNILFTDEASFIRDGINNVHNIHVWGDENPHAIIASRHRFSVNV